MWSKLVQTRCLLCISAPLLFGRKQDVCYRNKVCWKHRDSPLRVCIILEMGLGGGIHTNWSDLPQLPSSVQPKRTDVSIVQLGNETTQPVLWYSRVCWLPSPPIINNYKISVSVQISCVPVRSYPKAISVSFLKPQPTVRSHITIPGTNTHIHAVHACVCVCVYLFMEIKIPQNHLSYINIL